MYISELSIQNYSAPLTDKCTLHKDDFSLNLKKNLKIELYISRIF